jgi:hypothetical protein
MSVRRGSRRNRIEIYSVIDMTNNCHAGIYLSDICMEKENQSGVGS